MKGLKVGYIRVSTADQNPERQLEGIELDKKFIDYASAKVGTVKKEFDSMMNFVREGDHVIVHSIDRIARNLINLLEIVKKLNSRGISIEFKKENMLFRSDHTDHRANLLLNMMGAFAEFEYALIAERRREGIEIARAKNKYKREFKLTTQQQDEVALKLSQHIRVAVLAEEYGCSRPTIYKCRKKKEISCPS